MLGIYCRVSTPGQEDNYSLPQQHKDGVAFATSKNLVPKEYEDVESGKSVTRSGYNELLKDIETKVIDSVWIAAEDRFSRDATLGLQFLDLLVLHKMKLFVGTQEFDPRDSQTRFMIAVKFLVAEFEWSQIRERMRKGFIAYTNQGKRIPYSLYGYDAYFTEQGERRLRVNEDESKNVSTIFNLFQSGASLRSIARQLNSGKVRTKKYGGYRKNRNSKKIERIESLWSANHVKDILSHPEYTCRTWDWDHSKLLPSPTIPAIVERERWEEAQERLAKLNNHKGHDGIRATDHELSGICRCARCGAKYYYHFDPRRKKAHYWHTVGSMEQQKCRNHPHYIKMDELENVIGFTYRCLFVNSIESLPYIVAQEKSYSSKNEKLHVRTQQIENRLLDLEKEMLKLTEAIKEHGISKYLSNALKEGEDEEKELLKEKSEIVATLSLSESDFLDQVNAFREERLQAFLSGDSVSKRTIYYEVIKVATVEDGMLTVAYSNGKLFKILLGRKQNSIYRIDVYFMKEFQISIDFHGSNETFVFNRQRFNELFNATLIEGTEKKPQMDVLFATHMHLIQSGGDKGAALSLAMGKLMKNVSEQE